MDHKHSNHDVDKDRQGAENVEFGVPSPGMRVEDLPVAFEEEEAIADMISEGSPVVPGLLLGRLLSSRAGLRFTS